MIYLNPFLNSNRTWVFPCGSAGKESTCNVGDLGSISGLGRSSGWGKGYPLQYSGLENLMECIVHGVKELDMTERLSLPSKLGLPDRSLLLSLSISSLVMGTLFLNDNLFTESLPPFLEDVTNPVCLHPKQDFCFWPRSLACFPLGSSCSYLFSTYSVPSHCIRFKRDLDINTYH